MHRNVFTILIQLQIIRRNNQILLNSFMNTSFKKHKRNGVFEQASTSSNQSFYASIQKSQLKTAESTLQTHTSILDSYQVDTSFEKLTLRLKQNINNLLELPQVAQMSKSSALFKAALKLEKRVTSGHREFKPELKTDKNHKTWVSLTESQFQQEEDSPSMPHYGRATHQILGGNFQRSKPNEQKMNRKSANLIFQKKIQNIQSEYYVSSLITGGPQKLGHLSDSMQIIKSYLNNITSNPKPKIHLPKKQSDLFKKVLVLDLDQTLISSHYQKTSAHQIQIDIDQQDQETEKAYIAIRPFALSFLRKMAKMFEIIVFTAAEQTYADAILDYLDPDSSLISHRLYRQHCHKICSDAYCKDLSIIDRDLSRMVLVDNSAYSFLTQLDNAIPIISFMGQPDDRQLLNLQTYLDKLWRQTDIRVANRQYFKLHRYGQFKDCNHLLRILYNFRFVCC